MDGSACSLVVSRSVDSAAVRSHGGRYPLACRVLRAGPLVCVHMHATHSVPHMLSMVPLVPALPPCGGVCVWLCAQTSKARAPLPRQRTSGAPSLPESILLLDSNRQSTCLQGALRGGATAVGRIKNVHFSQHTPTQYFSQPRIIDGRISTILLYLEGLS